MDAAGGKTVKDAGAAECLRLTCNPEGVLLWRGAIHCDLSMPDKTDMTDRGSLNWIGLSCVAPQGVSSTSSVRGKNEPG
jgi:hypothetical protein